MSEKTKEKTHFTKTLNTNHHYQVLMQHIMSFREITNNDTKTVGVKGVNLAALAPHYKVPPGFVITTSAYEEFLNSAGINEKIGSLLKSISESNIQDVANNIQKLIVQSKFPEELTKDILEAYESLSFKGTASAQDLLSDKSDANVAIRSSYTEKHDTKDLSQLTLLNIKGETRLLTALKVAWAAQFTSKNIETRKNENLNHDVKNAVIVQKMVDATTSALCYSFNPNTKDHDEIYVKGIFGLGEGFTIGDTAFDAYVINKKDLRIKEAIIAEQSSKHVLDFETNKTSKVLLKDQGKKQKLHDTDIREAARLTKKISAFFDSEQRVEISINKEGMFILQSKHVGEKVKVAPPPEDMTIESVEQDTEEDIEQEPPQKVESYFTPEPIQQLPQETETIVQEETPIPSFEQEPQENITITEKKDFENDDDFLKDMEEEATSLQEPLTQKVVDEQPESVSDSEKDFDSPEDEYYDETEDLKDKFDKEDEKEESHEPFFEEKEDEQVESKDSDFKFEEDEEDNSIFSSFKSKRFRVIFLKQIFFCLSFYEDNN